MEPLIPQNPTQEAQQLGLPADLFGFTPQQYAYWHEPGLPWLTAAIYQNPPPDHLGGALVWQFCEFSTDSMAPRFPRGCRVNLAPVYERANLQVGKVYVYAYRNPETGEKEYQAGRLVKIGGNALWALADNAPRVHLCWLLRADERQAVWDVFEVTHYAFYPEL